MSLYHIEEDLLRIFAEIEENEGEMSDELLARLDITKENLTKKLDGYVKAVRSYEGDVKTVKEEVKRLNANAKVRENRIERLKKAMLQAVQMFGNEGKTNKFIDLPTVKLFTKGSEAIVTDDLRIDKLLQEFDRFVRELHDNGILYTGSDVELQGILDSINANLKAEHETTDEDVVNIDRGEEFVPYTLTDLTNIKVEISTTKSIYDLFRTGRPALELYCKDPIYARMRNVTGKEDWKSAITIANGINLNMNKEDGGDERDLVSLPTVAKIVKNVSIQMR